MYKICFYVPETHVDIVKNAMFAAGAGVIGNYSHCAWQVLGEGQYLPLNGSNPFMGTVQSIEKVAEYKVEMVCEDKKMNEVVTALKEAHPYEVPAYQIWLIENS